MVNRAHNTEDGSNSVKPWRWILVDSAIIGAIAMAAVMPGEIPRVSDIWVMAKAFFAAFIVQVGIERGLKKLKPAEKPGS